MLSFDLARAAFASSKVSFIRSLNSLMDSTWDRGWSSSKPIWGMCPVSRRKGGCWVDEWTWLLYWNSVNGRSPTQSSCLRLVKRLLQFHLHTYNLLFLYSYFQRTTGCEHMFFLSLHSSCITHMLHASDACFSYIPLLLCWTHVEHVPTMRYAHVSIYINCS